MSSCRKWQFKAVYCFLKRAGTYHTCLLLFQEIRNLPHLSVNNDLYFEQERGCCSNWCSRSFSSFLCVYIGVWLCYVVTFFSLLQQEDKIYVQHKLLENSSLIWNLLTHKQGWFYIAGYDKWSLSHGINIACASAVFFPISREVNEKLGRHAIA